MCRGRGGSKLVVVVRPRRPLPDTRARGPRREIGVTATGPRRTIPATRILGTWSNAQRNSVESGAAPVTEASTTNMLEVGGMRVDLDLKAHYAGGMGPHGLVSGDRRSKLLRSIVLGLAVTHGHEDVELVLIDADSHGTFDGLHPLPQTSRLCRSWGPGGAPPVDLIGLFEAETARSGTCPPAGAQSSNRFGSNHTRVQPPYLRG